MDQQYVNEMLTSDSDEIADIKANLDLLEGFVNLIRDIDALPDINKRFYEDSRSLYQTTAVGCDIAELEKILQKYFGEPIKTAGKSLPRKLRKSSVVKYLGGIQKDQSLFSKELKTGKFYGALWPWRRNKAKIEIHLGYCSDWMTDEDYLELEAFVHRAVSHGAFSQMNANIGGQIHGISLPSFLQMAEMEKSSFTLRVTSRHRVGELHLSDGNLVAAQLDESTGCEAAYRIISWDDVSIDIDPLNETKAQDINMPLMHILMESLKLKDEAAVTQEKPPPLPKGRPKHPPSKGDPSKRLVRLQRVPTPVVPRRKKRFITLVGGGVGAFAVLAAVAVVSFHILENRRASGGYEDLVEQVEQITALDQKIDLLNLYLAQNPKSEYSAAIQNRIKEINLEIAERAFEQATLEVSGLPLDEHYESRAIEIYRLFLEKYPNGSHTRKVNQSISEIKNLLDQYYYEELKRAARLDFNKRLEAYRKYLSQFPEGKYKKDVEILINEMGEKYLSYLHDEAAECEKSRRWDTCIAHSKSFVEAYAGLELSQRAVALKKQLEDKRDYFQLRRSADDVGRDYLKALELYKRYLADHPKTTQRKVIVREMDQFNQEIKIQRKWLAVKNYASDTRYSLSSRIRKLDQYIRGNINSIYAGDAQSLLEQLSRERQISLRRQQVEAKKQSEQARVQSQLEEQERRRERVLKLQTRIASQLKGSSRYQPNGDGTLSDSSTGLTWAIVDSYQELGRCMTYGEALKYIKTLRHGGHRSWRMPTAYELASIYKKSPYFPNSGAKWYWSSETAVKGYHTVADIVTANHQPIFQREQRALTDCGSVRAILFIP